MERGPEGKRGEDMSHRDEKLDAMIGKNVEITTHDGTKAAGVFGYADDFSAKHDYRKPEYYYVGNLSLRKSHIIKIVEK